MNTATTATTVRVPDELLSGVRHRLTDDGDSFQSLVLRLLHGYVRSGAPEHEEWTVEELRWARAIVRWLRNMAGHTPLEQVAMVSLLGLPLPQPPQPPL